MPGKPKILVVTSTIPKPDKSSGELRFLTLLEFLSKYWEIDFCISRNHVHANLSPDQLPYIKMISNLGIKVLPIQNDTFNKAIKKNQYDGAYFNMFWIAEECMTQFISALPEAFTIVDSVDVHFAREETHARLGEIEYSTVQRTKERELDIYKKANITIVVSKDDYHLLAKIEGIKNVVLVPNIVKVYPRKQGKRDSSVIFIGSYSWYPNPDAVLWFSNFIWPTIYKSCPNARFLVIGSNPTEDVLALKDKPGIEVIGYVSETKPYFDRAALSVAPMRIGGGMKGKVNEAMAHGIPVVATNIGAQGFDAVNELHMMITDTENQFAEYVIRLIQDESLQESIGLAGQELNSSLCSHDAVKLNIDELISLSNGLIPVRYRSVFSKLKLFKIRKLFRIKN